MHRVGMIVPSSNTTMETEVPALLRKRERVRPEDRFTFHSARVRMQHVTPEELRAMNALAAIDEVERQSGLPTLSAATATTWAILRALELEPAVPGAGALLASTAEPAVPRPS